MSIRCETIDINADEWEDIGGYSNDKGQQSIELEEERKLTRDLFAEVDQMKRKMKEMEVRHALDLIKERDVNKKLKEENERMQREIGVLRSAIGEEPRDIEENSWMSVGMNVLKTTSSVINKVMELAIDDQVKTRTVGQTRKISDVVTTRTMNELLGTFKCPNPTNPYVPTEINLKKVDFGLYQETLSYADGTTCNGVFSHCEMVLERDLDTLCDTIIISTNVDTWRYTYPSNVPIDSVTLELGTGTRKRSETYSRV